MTMTLDRPNTNSRRSAVASDSSAAQRLRANFAAVRVNFTWFGVRKSLSTEQKAQAAEQFGAEGQFLSAAKKLLDNKHPAFQAVTSVRSQILSFWKGMSLPYPEPGIRLIKQDDVDQFNDRMTKFRDELTAAVDNLDEHFDEMKSAARDRLGSLFNMADYPPTLRGLFGVEFDFPSTEPPEYLLRLNPDLFAQERNRISARFDEAVRLAEEAFVGEFGKLIGHFSERLTAGVDGDKKIFRDTALTNLADFFQRFRSLNVRSNADLERLVETAERTLAGADPQAVRDNDSLRQQITTQLSAVQASLDTMLVDQPRRRILRGAAAGSREERDAMATEIVITGDGTVRCVYGEALDLAALGFVEIRRASSVEPDPGGDWFADLAPVNGPKLGPFSRRSDALSAETRWLNEHWLVRGGG